MTKGKTLNILITSAQALTVEGYKSVLQAMFPVAPNFTVLESIEKAIESVGKKGFNLTIIDLCNNRCANASYFSSLSNKTRKRKNLFAQTELLVLTEIEERIHLQNILCKLHPGSVLLKNNLQVWDFKLAVQALLNGCTFYCPKVSKIMQTQAERDKNLDHLDFEILHYLAQGVDTKYLSKYIALSLRAIENRKQKLKALLGVTERGNYDLLRKARANGFV